MRIPRGGALAGRLGVALAVAASCVLGSCPAEQAQELEILDMIALTPQLTCQLRPDQGEAVIRPYGILDLAFTNEYWLFPRMKNMMPTMATQTGEGPANLVYETNTITVQTAHVLADLGEFYEPGLSDDDDIFDVYTVDGMDSVVATSIDPNASGAVAIQAIPPQLGNELAGKLGTYVFGPYKGAGTPTPAPAIWITLYVQVTGETQDRWPIHSNVYAFPVQVCWGCLLQMITNECAGTVGATEYPCKPGQDDFIDNNYCPYSGALYFQSGSLKTLTFNNQPVVNAKYLNCNVCDPHNTGSNNGPCPYGCNPTVDSVCYCLWDQSICPGRCILH
jgi:hypothetical protein